MKTLAPMTPARDVVTDNDLIDVTENFGEVVVR